jgi:hypothetical protein
MLYSSFYTHTVTLFSAQVLMGCTTPVMEMMVEMGADVKAVDHNGRYSTTYTIHHPPYTNYYHAAALHSTPRRAKGAWTHWTG